MAPLSPETSSEEEQPAPQRVEARRSGPSRRRESKLIQGAGDMSSDDYDDGEFPTPYVRSQGPCNRYSRHFQELTGGELPTDLYVHALAQISLTLSSRVGRRVQTRLQSHPRMVLMILRMEAGGLPATQHAAKV